MPFQPIANYAGHNHILQAGAQWVHPGNGNTYCCACEQKSGAKQNLSVYRMIEGGSAWSLVTRYQGTIDSAGHITMGAASIERSGDMLVTTSLIIPGAEKVTTTGFVGSWIREPNMDEPWSSGGAQGPQGPRGEPGAGGVVLYPAPFVAQAWGGRALSGGELIDIPTAFGVPSASAYLVRLSGLATTAGVVVRAGSPQAPYFLTLMTQVANMRMDAQGWIPGPVALVSTVAGGAQVWMQVIGSSA
jgi:hypothetical protein